MKLKEAQTITENLIWQMKPYCERIEVGGSVRRLKPEVGDLELVLIPKWEDFTEEVGLFGEEVTTPQNALYNWATQTEHGIQWIKPGTPEIEEWPLKPDAKYWRAYLPGCKMKLDVWVCTPQNWGNTLLIRTGSSDFNKALVTHAQAIGRPFDKGRATIRGIPVEMFEERDVFKHLNLKYIEPQDRRDGWAVVRETT